MKAELIDVSECKKNLEIEIPHEAVDAEITHIAQEFARKARVPGFRPGKAPIGVVKNRYRDEILSEMMQHLLPKYFGAAVEDRKLDIVDTPHFEGIDYNAGQPLKFKAIFEVYPQLNISNYIGIPVQETSTEVQESEVEASLKKLQEDMAEHIDPESAICIYRIVQEALNNIAKHAQASTCRVLLRGLPRSVEVVIEDNGMGFQAEPWDSNGSTTGVGLKGIRERVNSLQGTFRLETGPGRGTRIWIELPRRESGATVRVSSVSVQVPSEILPVEKVK